jgi:hypothetical protein
MKREPTERLNVAKLLKHPFLQNISDNIVPLTLQSSKGSRAIKNFQNKLEKSEIISSDIKFDDKDKMDIERLATLLRQKDPKYESKIEDSNLGEDGVDTGTPERSHLRLRLPDVFDQNFLRKDIANFEENKEELEPSEALYSSMKLSSPYEFEVKQSSWNAKDSQAKRKNASNKASVDIVLKKPGMEIKLNNLRAKKVPSAKGDREKISGFGKKQESDDESMEEERIEISTIIRTKKIKSKQSETGLKDKELAVPSEPKQKEGRIVYPPKLIVPKFSQNEEIDKQETSEKQQHINDSFLNLSLGSAKNNA